MYRVDSHEIELVVEDEPLIVTVDEPGSVDQLRIMSCAPDGAEFLEADEITTELFDFLTYLMEELSDFSTFDIDPGELPQSEFIVLGTACSHALAHMNVEKAVEDIRDTQSQSTNPSETNAFKVDTTDSDVDSEDSSNTDLSLNFELNDNGTVDIEDMR